MKTIKLITMAAMALLITISVIAAATAPQPTLQQRVAALKSKLAASRVNLKKYEWVQTTIVTVKGKEKARKQEICYFGTDGVMQKLEVNSTGKMTDYMKNAVNLTRLYAPLDTEKIQAAIAAGKISIDLLEPGKRSRVNVHDYLKAGDNVGVELNLTNNAPLGVTVYTYLDKANEPIIVDARMAWINDGTLYPAVIALNSEAKGLNITVENSGFRKSNRGGK